MNSVILNNIYACIKSKKRLTNFPNPGIFGSEHSTFPYCHQSYRHKGGCTCHGNAFVEVGHDDKPPIQLKCPCKPDIALQESIVRLSLCIAGDVHAVGTIDQCCHLHPVQEIQVNLIF